MTTNDSAKLALVLGGGGARAAYQAGFLRSLARAFPDLDFPVLTGVSAGAINAAHLANSTDGFPESVDRLVELWSGITVDQVFRTDLPALGTTMLRWALRLVSGGAPMAPPTRGLVDTAPLRRFLKKNLGSPDGTLRGIDEKLRSGRLAAVGITTTHYGSGESVTWAQGREIPTWHRPGRQSMMTTLTVDHILASCALPLFFPAVQLGDDWHGDGGLRLTAPLSPALHFGARKMIAVSTQFGGLRNGYHHGGPHDYPPPATIIGLLLESVFMDMLDADALAMRMINQLLADHPRAAESGLRPVELLLIRPSRDLSAMANQFERELPPVFRFVTRGLGTRESRRADLLATVLFQPRYIARMIEIGEEDGNARREEITRFLGR
ncbi:MAG TPA: patatin-like phospholipase family protein [Rariglobus sp.]|jgi:NTE family protein|nr:patatin-like phospholipase family protein [Rariglobus sp.]